ncbi:MAG: OB-fold nucleic acid binding domain-containing protein [Candidatus Aenigmarchaeota archaeon]|nr:OB-fold nucleic acid binding domain-containing protein [Candidatus Aenigmarchaeota archaeon]
MNKKSFTIVCIFTSFLGIVIMFFTNKLMEPEKVRISQITLDQNYVLLNATITSVQTKSNIVILTIKDDTGTIQAVIYENQTSLKPGDRIELLGKPQKYKEKIQIKVLDLSVVQIV